MMRFEEMIAKIKKSSQAMESCMTKYDSKNTQIKRE